MKRLFALLLLSCLAATAHAQLPDAWDWRDVGGVDYVSPHRNNGSCGITWIFAPVGVVEARVRIAVVGLGEPMPDPDYSEQHILSCGSGYFGDFSCAGGYALDVFAHIRDHGVPDESCHVYDAVEEPCPATCPDGGGGIVLHWPVAEAGEMGGFPADAEIMQEIRDHGPVAATMDVYQDFHSYAGGVYRHLTGALAGGTVVQVVGWGDDGGDPYWICRNSWGSGWGDGGDFRIARDALHANCDFGEYVWSCTIDEVAVDTEPVSAGTVRSLYR